MGFPGKVLILMAAAGFFLSCMEPPWLSEKWLKEADAELNIRILDVDTRDRSILSYRNIVVVIKAKVLKVFRSKEKLKKGDTITVVYSHNYKFGKSKNGGDNMLPGPSVIPVLRRGQTVHAYLNIEKNGIYRPAALAKSFSSAKIEK